MIDLPRPSRTLDFKRMGENKVVKKLLETICTYANTEGCVLALGVADTSPALNAFVAAGEARAYGT